MADQDLTGAVLVVGGGIAGMQASLDLANSGYQVHLVENKSAIGGRMAQLDKTFPTNDCAMCTISPRLVEVGTHANIEIITNAEVDSLSGKPGNFSAAVTVAPKFVDPDKCTGCGLCAESCPVPVTDSYNQGLKDRRAIFKLYPQAVPNKFTMDRKGVAPCYDSCPVHGNPSGYVALVAAGRYMEAYEAAVERNPFPSICGRVCVHNCEQNCNRGPVDSAVSIASLKRFLADWYVREGAKAGGAKKRSMAAATGKKVAVVGAGPAGLSAALELRRLGYAVTVLEKQAVAGGMMRLGIPAYRLPNEVVETDIRHILEHGVELQTGREIKGEADIEKLFTGGYSAVYYAVGSWRSGRLRLEGEDLPGVSHGVNFLRDVRLGAKTAVKERVVIIGGGNVAIDCARSAVRLGAKSVDLVCLEANDAMPAHHWETEWALEENVRINAASSTKRIVARDGAFAGLELLEVERMSFKDGKLDLATRPGTERILEADELIIAVGQGPETGFAREGGKIQLTPRGTLVTDPLTGMTSWKGLFAGGDVVRGAASIIEAVADGQKAARGIDAFLNGRTVEPEPVENVVKLTPEDLKTRKVKPIERRKNPMISLDQRKSGFAEAELGMSEEDARAEAARCLYCATCSYCRRCEDVCEAKAINFRDVAQKRKLEVGAVVLAPGFDLTDARKQAEYGYGRFPNVLTGLDYERILSASGPFMGHIKRPSDHAEPRRIAFIQCVGSRDQDHPYCSSVCCMYATKQAIITKEHLPGAECTVFVMDVRAFGKGFDEYYERAVNKYGVRYVRTRPSMVTQDFRTNNLSLRFTLDGKGWREEEFDLVILSAGLCPSELSVRTANRLGVKLNRHSFAQSLPFSPASSSQPGIFLAGAFEGPKDIPESVTQASGAAALAMELLSKVRGTRVTERAFPPETDVKGQDPRIGVFVCHCGSNIGGVIDCAALAKRAAKLPGVTFTTNLIYTCSPDGLKNIREKIAEHGLNRVVVASCTPRTHEPLFQRTIREGGLNPFLFEMANIRDQCTWVHANMGEATETKAWDLVRMAVGRARTIEPLYTQTYEPKRRTLVVGGGVAGMTAALSVARQGYPVDLVEKSGQLGGNLHKVLTTAEGLRPAELLASLQKAIAGTPSITVRLNTTVAESTGFAGKFTTRVTTAGGESTDLEQGAVIIATGGNESRPATYQYGEHPGVVTQMQLEEKLAHEPAFAGSLKEVVMIQCVGSREPGRPSCCRVGCTESIKNALAVKKANPGARVAVLYRDIRTYGFKEELYNEARAQGVLFFRYDLDNKPVVSNDGCGNLAVSARDLNSGLDISFSPDLLVLTAAMLPAPDAQQVGTAFKVPLNLEGFFLEAHMKLRPVDFASDGIFLCGACHSPKFIDESVVQAQAAASRAVTILSKKVMEVGGVTAKVDPEKCASCLTCVRTCAYHVPRINADGVAEIETAMCHGCGTCASECPAKAIDLMHYKDYQVNAKTEALFDIKARVKIKAGVS